MGDSPGSQLHYASGTSSRAAKALTAGCSAARPGRADDSAAVVTQVLRDPVARLQSQLERMSDRPNHRLHELLSRPHVYNHSETSSLMGEPATVM